MKMGSVTNEVACGHIYLQRDVSGEFDKSLALAKFRNPDAFLEHLLELFVKTEECTKVVRVRPDLAQKFTTMQCRTQFRSSDDLMKHLLNLHVEHQKPVAVATPTQEKTSGGRKSRKSQPKKNVRHASLIDSDEESGGPSPNNRSSISLRDMSISSIEDPTDISTSEGANLDSMFDLSKVKQEVSDDDIAKAKQNEKDGREGRSQLSGPLHKPISAKDGNHSVLGKRGVSQSTLDALARTTRQFTQLDWRNRSEPVDHDLTNRPKHEPSSLQASPQGYGPPQGDDYIESLKKEKEDMKNGYNYVLTLAPTSPGSGEHGNGLPENSMQVPIRYPKSKVYTVSSDEEEPEDLSNSVHPQNQTLTKPRGAAKNRNRVKYDRNANAVAITMGNLQDAPIEPNQIPIPQNLLFHDPRSVSQVGPPPMLQMKPQNSQSPSTFTPPGGQPPTGMPSLIMPNPMQLLNFQNGLPPLSSTGSMLIRQGIVSPTSSAPILVPLSSLMSPANKNTPSKPSAAESDDSQSQDSPGRKKRKRMEDTTVFRDPPEQSLPFNGPNKYRFYCDVCDTGFTRRYTFNRHKCKGRVEKHYCQLCDKAYLSKYKLKDHILVKHEGQTVSCPECGKRFSSRSSMEMHKKQQHEGMYSIFCKICNKGFNHTGHYYGHMNKHTNTKPFWCQQCGKRFYGSSYLHNHKQVCRGNNELNYSCSICDRKFKCELYLKKHMKIHDNTPIINNPNVVKATDEDLAKAGVKVAELDEVEEGEMPPTSQPIFPNGPDFSDSNSSMMDIPDGGEMTEVAAQ
ncbi:zinc finger protein 263-like isoform X1 [Mya arenaria]|uniref:zinc finger protein 263-like isoform X1 n=1 Tax=Mya arenaria TaxID=6604 RepID=UPI0022E118BE|nr:zinc finger protein 263-like isoform X1 [Mya arenaria]